MANDDHRLRFFMCGEYGSKSLRPHFHALFFNLDFSDKKVYSDRAGMKLYTSDVLSSLWSDPVTGQSYGHVIIGSLTPASCGYVSRYCVKKAIDGDRIAYFNQATGEYLEPEKTNMSRMPGIGSEWFTRKNKDVFPDDFVVLSNGRRYKPPRYYLNLLEKIDPVLFEDIKSQRQDFANDKAHQDNFSVKRLIVREKIQLIKYDRLVRSL